MGFWFHRQADALLDKKVIVVSNDMVERGKTRHPRYLASRIRVLIESPSPYINQFISADTIVPNPADPQNLNRYSYVGNSPLNYTDPTGHQRLADGPTQNDFSQSVFDDYEPLPSQSSNGNGRGNGSNNNDEDDDNNGGGGGGQPAYSPALNPPPPVPSEFCQGFQVNNCITYQYYISDGELYIWGNTMWGVTVVEGALAIFLATTGPGLPGAIWLGAEAAQSGSFASSLYTTADASGDTTQMTVFFSETNGGPLADNYMTQGSNSAEVVFMPLTRLINWGFSSYHQSSHSP